MASPKIQIKRGTTTPIVSDFSQGELALNHNNNTLYAQSGALTTATALAAASTFTIGSVTTSVSYLGVVGYTATMNSTGSNFGVAVGDILRGVDGVTPAVGAFPTSQCIVIAISGTPYNTLTFWSSGTPTAGVVTAVTRTSPLKWVGAEIENTLTSGNFNKLTTQAGIATYIGNTSLSLAGGTLTGALSLKNGTGTGELSFYEGSGGGDNFIKLKAPSTVTTNTTLTLPDGPPGANGYLLKSDTNGDLGWTAPTPATTIGATNDDTTASALPIVFIDTNTLKTTSAKLKFIPTTGVLTSTGFSATDATTTTSLNSTSLTTGTGTFNLINTTATTVNFAGAATTLSIGAGTGTTTINNNTVITGNLTTIGNTVHNGTFTVQGTQTYLNTTVMTVTDKNIELGFATATSGLAVSTSFTFALITFSNQGTVARIGSTGSFGRITFSSLNQIPTGVRPGTELNSGISGSSTAGYLGGGTITVTSITPTEIYYTATSGVPRAGPTTALVVVNDYISSTITLSGSTLNMAVGSAVTGTLVGATGSLNVATVGSILSGTTFTIVNRGAITGTVTSASGIATGASSDITADGGGFTLKGTTDKTFTWVSAANSTWPSGRFSMNQPLEVVQTCTGAVSANNSCLRLKSDATADSDGTWGAGGTAVDTMIEFTNITTPAGITSTAWFGVDKSNRLKFQTSRNTNVFSVDSSGKVEDCTIDCGTF